jgi:murein DD-endopeptidase MepM/ murein hydrolase activator NlpD
MHPRTRAPLHHLAVPALAPVLAVLLAMLVGLLVAPASAATDGPTPTPAGSAVWPLAPAPGVVRGFDPPDVRWGAGHRGVDLAGEAGQPVRAAQAGTVSYAGTLAGRGVVVVDHGTTRTTYEPVAADVHVGNRVVAGDRIGRLQRGGSHCAPAVCLHWGLLEGDRYLDPLTLVGAGPVRLLPLGGLPGGSLVVGSARTGTGLPASARSATPAPGPAVPSVPRSVPVTRGDAALFRETSPSPPPSVRRGGAPAGTPAAAGRS